MTIIIADRTNDLHQKMLCQRSLGPPLYTVRLDARLMFSLLRARFTARHTIAKNLGLFVRPR